MKKLFIAIWFIIAVLLIPLIYDTVDNAMNETISISLLLTTDNTTIDYFEGFVTNGTFDKLIQYIELDETIKIDLYIEDNLVVGEFFMTYLLDNDIGSYIGIDGGDFPMTHTYLFNDDTYRGIFPFGDEVNIRIEFETSSTGLWSTLLSLIPLVFVGGLIVYFVKKNGLSD